MHLALQLLGLQEEMLTLKVDGPASVQTMNGRTGEVLYMLKGDYAEYMPSADGRHLLLSTFDSVFVATMPDLKILHAYARTSSPAWASANRQYLFFNNLHQLAVLRPNGDVLLYDVATNRQVREVGNANDGVMDLDAISNGIQLDPSGRFLLVYSPTAIKQWDLDAGKDYLYRVPESVLPNASQAYITQEGHFYYPSLSAGICLQRNHPYSFTQLRENIETNTEIGAGPGLFAWYLVSLLKGENITILSERPEWVSAIDAVFNLEEPEVLLLLLGGMLVVVLLLWVAVRLLRWGWKKAAFYRNTGTP
jgi:hypothetical protein